MYERSAGRGKCSEVSWQATVLATPMLFAAVVAFALAGYAAATFRGGRRDPTVALLFWIAFAAAGWTGLSALKLLHVDPATKLLFYRALHVPAAVLPALMFLFIAAYTDRTRWLSLRAVAGVLFVPAVFVALVVTDPGGAVVAGVRVIEGDPVVLRVEDGPGFALFMLYSLGFVLAGLGTAVWEVRRVGRPYYPQVALISVALLAPLVAAAGTAAEVPPFVDDRMNLVPTAGAVSTVAIAALLGRYRLFDLPPLAYVTAMKYSPDPLLVLDDDGAIVHANERGGAFLDRLGASPGSDVRLSALLDGFSLDDAARIETQSGDDSTDAGESGGRNGTGGSCDPLAVPGPAGEPAYYRPFVEPLVRGGRRAGWVVVLRDETVQERRRRELERQNERMEAFSATVSHDLRNPLGVAQGYLELAETGDGPPDALEKVRAAHDRMETIITQLLLLAREGRPIGDLQSVDLGALARTAWSHVETGDATLTVTVEGAIRADPGTLQHVFENLFRNAIEHGGDEVSAVAVSPIDGGFAVSDDGVGVDVSEAEALDGDGDGSDGDESGRDGTGIGLTIVRTVVEAHGWAFRMTNGPDGGARAEITGVEAVGGGADAGDETGSDGSEKSAAGDRR
ncbi:hypothetical protein CK500_01960 [Halorubrum salipaludis]|uniref:histidine kinase n=1 Tax=Halorubrum salipaludis TaxID=2032630 RepID=A0A2A2FLJ0_9EURY|nr:hypothetical protein CK500_01960 [Halorubrum salipaludis]